MELLQRLVTSFAKNLNHVVLKVNVEKIEIMSVSRDENRKNNVTIDGRRKNNANKF